MTGVKLRSQLTNIQVIATGRSLRARARLRRLYGAGRWRKLKGEALVELPTGHLVQAELHWYEAHGVGRFGMKIKRLLG